MAAREQKIRDLERDIKTLSGEKEELERKEREWRKRREELEAVIPLFEEQGRPDDVMRARKVLAHFDSRGV